MARKAKQPAGPSENHIRLGCVLEHFRHLGFGQVEAPKSGLASLNSLEFCETYTYPGYEYFAAKTISGHLFVISPSYGGQFHFMAYGPDGNVTHPDARLESTAMVDAIAAYLN